jgi:cytoskeleton protein RodZ
MQAGGDSVQNPASHEKSFGPLLKRERERRGVTLDSISATTKVTVRYLQALEAERFDQLPGGILSKGIARGYVRCLGLDEGEWMLRYTEARQENDAAPGGSDVASFALNISTSRVDASAAHSSTLRWTGVGVLLLLLASFGWFVWSYIHARTNSAHIPQVPAVYAAAQMPAAAATTTSAPVAQPPLAARKRTKSRHSTHSLQ